MSLDDYHVTIGIYLDGPRQVTRDVPADWNTWTDEARCAFVDTMKAELLGATVAFTRNGKLPVPAAGCGATQCECPEPDPDDYEGILDIPSIAGYDLPCHMTGKPHGSNP